MNMDWLNDGRKIPDEAMFYIRGLAVHAVRVLGQSPEIVTTMYNLSRTCIYRLLKQYDEGGYDHIVIHKSLVNIFEPSILRLSCCFI